MGERLTYEEVHARQGDGHKLRYQIAKSFCKDHHIVLDAACGIGYGSNIIKEAGCIGPGVVTYRVDKLPVEDREPPTYNIHDVVADLNTWEPDFEFDIGVSFETIEHVQDYQHLLTQLKKAREWIICSVPVIPTKHINEWHLHDFAPLELPGYIEDDDWEMYSYLEQPTEFSEIYFFRRKNGQ